MTKPTVFFDGSCPLCLAEIGFYRRQRGADAIIWTDVSGSTNDVATGLSCQRAMARFHVQTATGEIMSGAAAFAELWTWLPAFRLAGRIAGLPGVVHVLDVAYRAFLPVRPFLQRFFKKQSEAR